MKMLLALILLALLGCAEKKPQTEGIKIGQAKIEQTPLEASIKRGKLVYDDFCAQCHMPDGKGVPGAFPPLAGSDWLKEKRTASIHAVKFGQEGEITVNGDTYNGVMTSMGLSDEEVADVLNYVMNSWGNSQEKPITAGEVGAVEK